MKTQVRLFRNSILIDRFESKIKFKLGDLLLHRCVVADLSQVVSWGQICRAKRSTCEIWAASSQAHSCLLHLSESVVHAAVSSSSVQASVEVAPTKTVTFCLAAHLLTFGRLSGHPISIHQGCHHLPSSHLAWRCSCPQSCHCYYSWMPPLCR